MICPSDKKFGGGTTPTGTIQITQNGTVDVTDYATADMAVPNDNTMFNGELSGAAIDLVNDEVTTLRERCFYNYTALKSAHFGAVTSMSQRVFYGCTGLKRAYFPKLTTLNQTEQFRGCTQLNYLDFPVLSSFSSTNTFNGCSALNFIVLRRTSGIVTLTSTNTFSNTPFLTGNGGGGTIYVPYSLVSNYQGNSTWSQITYATFKSIQENLATLYLLGVNIDEYRLIVDELPTTDIDDTKTYWIYVSGTTYHQYFYGSGSWEQLADITL